MGPRCSPGAVRSYTSSLSLIAALGGVGGGLLFAGPLNPPAGPVTSTYKTLSEIEPRTNVQRSDIQAFFFDWENATGCSHVNQDGGIDGADVGAFFLVWEAGGC